MTSVCGILAVYNKRVSDELFVKALDRLEHRGPDYRGVWCNNKRDCRLGHRRLSILDLSMVGNQPMSSNDKRYWITFNGEVYNYIEIRKQLREKGYRFISNSDTEVVVNAFQEWGEQCLEKFNGMWAFVIYDAKGDRCFFSRDRFGIKPLFLTEVDNGYVFASEMKALMPFMKEPKIDDSFFNKKSYDMSDYMIYESTKKCLIKGIERVEAGVCGWVSREGRTSYKWWNTIDHLMDVPNKYDEQCDYFKELFLDACRIRMRSDVTLGTCLSGGLDSSATICAMNYIAKSASDESVNNDFQHAFVAEFPGTDLDETEYANEVVKYLNIPKTGIRIDAREGLSHLEKEIYCFEELYITTTIPMMQTYRELRKQGVYVTLDGHGADELFGGYSSDVLYALYDTKPYSGEWRSIYSLYRNMTGARGITKQDLKNLIRYNSIFSHSDKVGFERDSIFERDILMGNQGQLEKYGRFDRALYNDTHNTILPTLLRNYDRYSMASGVEIRMPFMDWRVVSFAFSIGKESKLRGNTKSIVRDSLKDIMPEKIVARKSKVGFSSPMKDWFQKDLRTWIMDSISSEAFKTCPVIVSEDVKKALMKVLTTNCSSNDATLAWMQFMPFLWYEHFYKRAISTSM